MRPDGIAFVSGNIEAVLALAPEYSEVVIPEINEQFFELMVAVDSPYELAFLYVCRNSCRRICGKNGPPALDGISRQFADLPGRARTLGVAQRHILQAHPQALIRLQALRENRVFGHPLGMQLQIQPFVEA